MNNQRNRRIAAAATTLAAVGAALLILIPNASAFTVIDQPASDAPSSCSSAKTMTTTSDTSARGELALPGDQYDNFRWSIYRTEKMNFEVTEDQSAQVFEALMRDPSCAGSYSMSVSTVTGGRHKYTGSIKAASTGYHSLQVFALPGSANGYYWVTYSTQQDDANSGGDVTDSSSSGYTIPAFGTVSGLVSPRYSGDDDYYRVSVPALGTFKTTLDQDGITNLDLQLVGKTTVSSGTAAASTKSLYCVNASPLPVTITVRVFQSGGSTTGTGAYNLSNGSGTSTVASESTVC